MHQTVHAVVFTFLDPFH